MARRVLAAASFSSVVVAVGAASCTESVEITWRSGSRLERSMLDAGEGAVAFVSMRDTVMNVDCGFRELTDGTWRCLPSTAELAYADAACTERVLLQHGNGCGPVEAPYALELGDADGCGLPHVVALYEAEGDPLPEGTAVFRSLGGECEALDGPSVVTRARKAEMAAFARGDRKTIPGESGVVVEIVDGEDGSRFVVGLRDEKRDVRCEPDYVITGGFDHDSCVPTPWALALNSYAFADFECSQRAVPLPTCGGELDAIVAYDEDECGGEFVLHEAGPTVDLEQPFVMSGGVCTFGSHAPQRWGTVGGVAAPGTFGTVAAHDVGSGRVVARYIGTTNGETALFTSFVDTEFDERCSPARMSDGVLRCISMFTYGTVFADAACTVPLFSYARAKEGCEPFTTPRHVVTETGGCGRNVASAREVLEFETLAKVHHRGPDGACTALTPDPDDVFARLSDELPPSAFVKIESVTN